MAEMANEGTAGNQEVGSPAGGDNNAPQGGNDNPAWQDLLSAVPEDLHEQIKPHLQKWDQNFDQVQSKFAPYKDFAEKNVSPEDLQYAYQVAQQMETNPMEMIKALTDYAKENNLWQEPEGANPVEGEDGQGLDDEELPDITQHPQFVELKQLVETIGTQLLEERQAKQAAEEDAQLDSELTALEKEFGEFDRDWVLTKALQAVEAGQDVTDLKPFVEQYRQHEQSIIEKSKRPAPRLIPSGGQAPDNTVDFKNMSDADRRKYIAERVSTINRD